MERCFVPECSDTGDGMCCILTDRYGELSNIYSATQANLSHSMLLWTCLYCSLYLAPILSVTDMARTSALPYYQTALNHRCDFACSIQLGVYRVIDSDQEDFGAHNL